MMVDTDRPSMGAGPTACADQGTDGTNAGGDAVCAVVGNPQVGSRTFCVANHVAGELSALLGVDDAPWTVDLAEHARHLFDWGGEELDALLARVARSRVLVVASPTFKATYTGLLKAFFDRYANNALAGVVAVPVMVGAVPVHALAPEVHLRPLLVELGASVPTRGLYVMESQLPTLEDVVQAWLAEGGPRIRRSLSENPEGA